MRSDIAASLFQISRALCASSSSPPDPVSCLAKSKHPSEAPGRLASMLWMAAGELKSCSIFSDFELRSVGLGIDSVCSGGRV